MKAKYIYVVLLSINFIFTIPNLIAQTILNGSFENNSALTSVSDLSNTNFNQTVSNVNAFGNNNQLDLYTGSTWATWSLPYSQNQNWRVALATEESTGKVDALALKISSPLIQGGSYSISYYDIGRSSDPLGGQLEIGISTDSSSFGTLVYTSPLAQNNVWIQRLFNFTSPNNGKYVTIRALVGNTSYGFQWTFVDNFTLSTLTEIPKDVLSQKVQVYPNPATGILNIENYDSQFTSYDILIYNILGEPIFEMRKNKNQSSTEIDLSSYSKGIYFVEINTEQNTITKKIIKE